MRLAFLAWVTSTLVLGMPARATTYFVAPDGSGDYATIQAAVTHAANGDIIELGDGTFRGNGNRDVDYGNKQIVIRSRSLDPTRCVIDCAAGQSSQHYGFRFGTGCGRLSILQAVTVEHGYGSNAAGIYVEGGDPTIRGCIIRENVATGEGGGLHVWGGAPLVERCVFVANSSPLGAGAAASIGMPDEVAVFDHCVFIGNYGADEGGGVRL
jgi:hypothetical protein